jgi:hypothetical protein
MYPVHGLGTTSGTFRADFTPRFPEWKNYFAPRSIASAPHVGGSEPAGKLRFSSGKKGATTMGVFRSAGFLAEATRESIVLFE